MKSIFEYRDYRGYLRDYYVEQKGKSAFSYRFFAARGGISNPVLLKMVTDGKCNLTKATVRQFIKAMQLGDTDAEYFENLVFYNQSRLVKDKEVYLKKLQSIGSRLNVFVLSRDQFEYYRHWHQGVLRELAASASWDGDYRAMGKALEPPLKTREVKSSLNLLERLGLLTRTLEGRYRQSHANIASRPALSVWV